MKILGGIRARLRGFTLIELLIVISIIGILITLTMVAVVPVQKKSRDARRKADINNYLSSLDLFKSDFKLYPNYTFNLGDQGVIGDGDTSSNFGLGTDIANGCNALGATQAGYTGSFTSTGNPQTADEFNNNPIYPTKIKLKPGFVSVNHFLACLRYTDRLLSDPKPGPLVGDGYQLRVSYDYSDVIVTALLENTNDSDASYLFTDANANSVKRYYRGSGVIVRHLDDSSDTSAFWGYLGNMSTNIDGKYLYQCKKISGGAVIVPDNRILYEPIVSSSASVWIANTNCENAAADLDVVPTN